MQPSMDTCEGHTPPRRATRRSSLVGEVRGRLGLCPSPQPASSDQTEFLHLKVALEADDGDSVEHFALHFSSSEAAGDAQKAMASAQAAEAEAAGSAGAGLVWDQGAPVRWSGGLGPNSRVDPSMLVVECN